MTINDIKNQIINEAQNQDALSGLTSTSKAAIFNLWAYATAFVIWLQYEFFSTYQKETDEKIKAQKRYTLLWFRNKALSYRHGETLPNDNDEYETEVDETTNLPIARAAVIELELNNRKNLFIKVASEGTESLTPVEQDVKSNLEQYFAHIKPAGTKIVIFTGPADQLKLNIRFFYDPLILDENGARIDGTQNTPVQDVIKDYLRNLKFNGEFTLTTLQDLLQDVNGCADREAYIDNAEANYLTPPEWQVIQSSYVANSGYMDIADENLNIQFIAKTVQL